MLESIVNTIGHLAAFCESEVPTTNTFTCFVEHCSELCVLISQQSGNDQSICETLERFLSLIDCEIQATLNCIGLNPRQSEPEFVTSDIHHHEEVPSPPQKMHIEDDDFVSDFSDDDQTAEDAVEERALIFVNDLQIFLTQNPIHIKINQPISLLELHKLLSEHEFEHDADCLIYIASNTAEVTSF